MLKAEMMCFWTPVQLEHYVPVRKQDTSPLEEISEWEKIYMYFQPNLSPWVSTLYYR